MAAFIVSEDLNCWPCSSSFRFGKRSKSGQIMWGL